MWEQETIAWDIGRSEYQRSHSHPCDPVPSLKVCDKVDVAEQKWRKTQPSFEMHNVIMGGGTGHNKWIK